MHGLTVSAVDHVGVEYAKHIVGLDAVFATFLPV
jgi:hypothetical protein